MTLTDPIASIPELRRELITCLVSVTRGRAIDQHVRGCITRFLVADGNSPSELRRALSRAVWSEGFDEYQAVADALELLQA